ncbi:MAG TPA: hydroxymethylbilane synthase [Tepidisphaeraceae bacterium]|nr:hydroxymethylbilane synthase [Tepidisphaeraceae bacterium]
MTSSTAAPATTLRLGTRGSVLAKTQSQLIADELEKRNPGLTIELIVVRTSGDTITDRPLHELGGKGLFTKEIEIALLEERVDFAVHSFKDVPVTMPLVDQSGLSLVATPEREDASDVIVFPRAFDNPGENAGGLTRLRQGARVGTGSLRRRCQLLALRPDLRIEHIRGNIDTRLKKLANDEFDVIVLAYAGLHRAGMFDAGRMIVLSGDEMLPAPGQGALALQCRRDDQRTSDLLMGLNDPETSTCVAAERALVMALQGNCHSPIAALARVKGVQMSLSAAVGGRDGNPPVIRASAEGPVSSPQEVIRSVHEQLTAQGAAALLAP